MQFVFIVNVMASKPCLKIVKLAVIISFAKRSRRVASQASPNRLISLILLIALAMTSAWLQGKRTKLQGKQKYVCRLTEPGRTRRRHSNFWIALYGENGLIAFYSCQSWVEQMLNYTPNKKSFYQQGLRAITLLQQPL